jgi:hypothetical protein
MVPRLNLGRVEECVARRAGTPRDEKKLGLRIESDVSRCEMQSVADYRYRLPSGGKVGRGRRLFGCVVRFFVCHCLQLTQKR